MVFGNFIAYNKSLDRSGGCAFWIIVGPAKLERIRAARSTQTGLLWAVPIFLIQYAGQPFPASMIAKEIGLELLECSATLTGMYQQRKT